jgi:hypothetical protein
LQEIKKKVNFINQSEIVLITKFANNKNLLFHNTTFTGTAFVSFQYEEYKEHILNKYYQKKDDFKF